MNASKISIELGKIASKLAKLAEQVEAMTPQTVESKPSGNNANPRRCWDCQLPLMDGERVVMEMHPTCQKRVMRHLQTEGITKEQAIAQGILPPDKKPGRKPKPASERIRLRTQEVKRLQQETSKADPKSKASPPPE
jgi:hypothetical protein